LALLLPVLPHTSIVNAEDPERAQLVHEAHPRKESHINTERRSSQLQLSEPDSLHGIFTIAENLALALEQGQGRDQHQADENLGDAI